MIALPQSNEKQKSGVITVSFSSDRVAKSPAFYLNHRLGLKSGKACHEVLKCRTHSLITPLTGNKMFLGEFKVKFMFKCAHKLILACHKINTD